MNELNQRSRLLGPFILGLLCVGTIVGLIIATTRGPGTVNDSAYYFSAATNLATGKGLTVDIVHQESPESREYFAAWPPLYPLLLGAGVRVGLSVESSARLLLVGASIIIVLSLLALAYHISHSWVIAGIAAAVGLTNHTVWASLPYALSEPPFMAFSFLALAGFSLTLAEADRGRYQWLLFLSSLALSLAMLTRYVGGAFLIAAMAVIVTGGIKRRTQIRRFVFLSLSVLPLIGWVGRNWYHVGSLTGTGRFGYPNSVKLLAMAAVSDLIPRSPLGLGGQRHVAALIRTPAGVVVTSLLAVCLVAFAVRHLKSRTMLRPRTWSLYERSRVVVFATLAYVVAIVIMSIFGNFSPRDASRLLVPVYPLVFVIGIAWAGTLLRNGGGGNALALMLALLLLSLQVGYAARFSLAAARDGLGFGASEWTENETLRGVGSYFGRFETDISPVVFSNFAPAVWLRYKRPVRRLDDLDNAGMLCQALRQSHAERGMLIALFSAVDPRVRQPQFYDPLAASLATCLGLDVRIEPTSDGVILAYP